MAFDTETSGKYPLTAEVCEVAGVKWQAGRIVGEFQSFVRTSKPMSEEVIAIHHITNEMLVGAPAMSQVICAFMEFVGDSYMVAHHAPFDMGFLAPEIERAGLPLPQKPVFCSSLLARKNIKGTENHKLQTLAKHLKINAGQAHRATDDARVCLELMLHIFKNVGEEVGLEDLFKYQEAHLPWSDYSISDLRKHAVYSNIIKSLEQNVPVQIVYAGGSRPGQARTVWPLGLVRNPLDDYFIAVEEGETIGKRYFLKRITAARF